MVHTHVLVGELSLRTGVEPDDITSSDRRLAYFFMLTVELNIEEDLRPGCFQVGHVRRSTVYFEGVESNLVGAPVPPPIPEQ